MAVFLTPDRVRDEYGLKINEKIIPDGSRVKPNRKLTTGPITMNIIPACESEERPPGRPCIIPPCCWI